MNKNILVLAALIFATGALHGQTTEKWVAPESADKLINKFNSAEDIAAGSDMYLMYCSVCHGESGRGDGPAGSGLPIPPADFTSEAITKQSDGALYWKLTTGKGNMVSYKSVLKEEELWQMISYIRSLSADK